VSQTLEIKDFDSVMKLDLPFSKRQHFVDSISKLDNYTENKLSYLYHIYAKYLSNTNNKDEGILYLNKAIVLRKKDQNNNLEPLKKSLFNLGLYLKRSNKYFKAIDIFKELANLPSEDRLRMKAYSELITLYYRAGDFEKSIRYFDKTVSYYIKMGDFRNLYKNYMRIASTYSSFDINKYSKEAENYLFKADSLRKYTAIDKRDDAIINLLLGNIYQEVKETKKALFHYNESLAFREEVNDSSAIAILYMNIGNLYLEDSILNEVDIVLKKGLIYAKENTHLKAIIYNNYGDYYKFLNEYDKSIVYYQRAIQLLVYGKIKKRYFNPDLNEVSSLSHKLRLFEFLYNKASYWQTRFEVVNKKIDLENALTDYKLADQLLDVIRFDSTEKTSKLFWREKGASLYMKAVEVSYLLNDMESAYFFMEKNKALLLLEELSDQQAKTVSNLPQKLIERDFVLKQKIIETEEATISNKTDVVFELKRSYEQFKDSIAANYPAYLKLRKSLPILNFDNHKANFINTDTATLQFILNGSEAYGLAVTKESTTLFHINDGVILQKEIGVLTKQLQQPFNTQTEVDAYVNNANSIFKKLIPQNIYEKLKGKKLTIAADGIIQNIPFEALVSDVTNQNSYLIKNNEINYVYSFSYLLSNNKKTRNPEYTFLGFAPEQFQDKSLAVLPNSINEVTSINSIFSDKTFIKDQASKLNFISNFDNYKIVHLATHSGSSNTEKPWLAFSDDKVNLNEIYATQNQADLVVLSACKTSQGEMKTGEGVMSLARGFFFSGTNSVISTLWNINDKTTQKIMHSFYSNLKDGQTKSKALHKSKLAYLSSNEGSMASPFYWSSFVLIGDAGIVSIESKTNWVLLLLLLVVVIAIGVAFKKIKNK